MNQEEMWAWTVVMGILVFYGFIAGAVVGGLQRARKFEKGNGTYQSKKWIYTRTRRTDN